MDAKTFGTRIRLARERRGLSQEDFAALISRDQRAVSEYEHGKRRIAAVDLPVFAQALDVSLLYFYEGDLSSTDLERAVVDELQRLPNLQAQKDVLELVRLFSAALQAQLS